MRRNAGFECPCPDTSLPTLRGYLEVQPREDPLTACVVAAFNAPRERESLRRLLAAFVPVTAELAWVWEAFAAGAPVYAQLLTGASKPDMIVCVDRGGQRPEIAAVAEAKISAEFNVPTMRESAARRWAALGLRPHLELWRSEADDLPGVPQTDTYALFEFDTPGCAPGCGGPARPVARPDREHVAYRLLYPHPVAAATATEPSVTGHLWQTTTFADLADALTPSIPAEAGASPNRGRNGGWAEDQDVWDRTLADVLRAVVVGKARYKRSANPLLPAVSPAQVREAAAAATVASAPWTGHELGQQRPDHDAADSSLDFVYGLQVDWDFQKAASVTPRMLRHDAYLPWSYTVTPTTVEWADEHGRPEVDERTGRPFRASSGELAHKFVLRDGNTRLRRLEVLAGLGHAQRFGWDCDREKMRLWPPGFPTAAGHLVVVTYADPRFGVAPPQAPGLAPALVEVLEPMGAVAHDVRSMTVGERVCAWLTYPPFPDEPVDCGKHPGAGSCQHATTGQMMRATMRALPVVAAYQAQFGLDFTDPYPIWAAHQDRY
ncbi:hypothetical protein [Nocardioides aquiterrae]|uniref:Uncharacterized protein n=1 Tax=Nocardioides aquiterrae TaxID=203799 RepID=A0ABN1UAL7_9ACTN